MLINFLSLILHFILSTELYSYTEEPEFALNRDYFEEDFRSHGTVFDCVCVCVWWCVWVRDYKVANGRGKAFCTSLNVFRWPVACRPPSLSAAQVKRELKAELSAVCSRHKMGSKLLTLCQDSASLGHIKHKNGYRQWTGAAAVCCWCLSPETLMAPSTVLLLLEPHGVLLCRPECPCWLHICDNSIHT